MLTINAGVSRKVGEPDFGSRGAAVHLELEVESHLVDHPDALRERIRGLFELVRQSVDAELQRPSNGSAHPDPVNSHDRVAPERLPSAPPDRTSNGPNIPSDSPRTPRNGSTRAATEAQLRAIRAMARRIGTDPQALANERFGHGLEQLSLPEASRLIDALKSQTAGNGHSSAGGTR